MPRLPQPGSDDGIWGDVLNNYLLTAHAADGTLKPGIVTVNSLQGGSVTASKLATASSPGDGQVLSYNGSGLDWTTVAGGGITDHGALTGRADDDHPQYHTDARGDARYYTQAQVDTSLAGKAATAHTHTIANVTNLQASLDGKAATSHAHAVADVTGLQTALDAKADDADITALDARVDTLEGYSKVLVLGAADPVPGGTPAGTVILRTT